MSELGKWLFRARRGLGVTTGFGRITPLGRAILAGWLLPTRTRGYGACGSKPQTCAWGMRVGCARGVHTGRAWGACHEPRGCARPRGDQRHKPPGCAWPRGDRCHEPQGCACCAWDEGVARGPRWNSSHCLPAILMRTALRPLRENRPGVQENMHIRGVCGGRFRENMHIPRVCGVRPCGRGMWRRGRTRWDRRMPCGQPGGGATPRRRGLPRRRWGSRGRPR